MLWCIGIDFGGVIVKPRALVRGEDTSLSDQSPGAQEAQPGAFESVKRLVEVVNGNVWIVSKAGPRMQELTLQWLEENQFYSTTGFPQDHVRFCLERADKKPICEELGITHFVDDRIHLMQILQHTVSHLYLFTPAEEHRHAPKYVTPVSTWAETLEHILGTLEAKPSQ